MKKWTDELEEMRARKDAAYEERNRVVALAAGMAIALGYKAGVKKTAIDGWDEEWYNCCYMDLPSGQVSWHYHDSHTVLFSGLPSYDGEWDGHDTKTKYDRASAYVGYVAGFECKNKP